MKPAAIAFAFSLAAHLLAPAPLAAQSVYPTGTTIWQQSETDDGYTLFVEPGGSAVLVDMDGTVANTWTSPTANRVLSGVEPLENGHILAYLRVPAGGVAFSRHIVEMDAAGNVVWFYKIPNSEPATTIFHHDSERLPNGNTMMLASQQITVPSISSRPLIDDFIVEVDPAGNIVWLWETWEHFDEFGFDRFQKALIKKDAGDWAHANSISVIGPNNHVQPEFAEGNVIVSQRYTNTVFIIDKTTGDIVWKIGPGGDQLTHGQHDPYMIPLGIPGEGNILVFDNGSGTGYAPRSRAPGRSAILEISPVVKLVAWEYDEGFRFWSNIVSGAQRLSNGNTLICSGVKGRLFEIKGDGTIVWEYMSPYSVPQGASVNTLVFRAYRVPYGWWPL